MISDFLLSGLSRGYSMTCQNAKQDFFWLKVGLTKERFNALWDYFKGLDKKEMIAEIEHDGFSEDGTPINGVVINVKHF